MNEAPLISLLLAVVSVLAVFTLVQYNQLSPHTHTSHLFTRSVIAGDRTSEPLQPGVKLISPHGNTTNQTSFLRSHT